MINSIIIDDDPSCIHVLRDLLQHNCKQVHVMAEGSSVDEAASLINQLHPDLVFLDVELNDQLSFALFDKVLNRDFYTIITTAHEKYALQAIKASCLEYLLKPILAEDLALSITKYEKQKQLNFNQKKIEVLLENIGKPVIGINKIAIPNHEGYVFLNTADIMYCEADSKYTRIFTNKSEVILSSKNLGEFEELLNELPFFRCHKSYIINVQFVKKYLKSDMKVIMMNDSQIDVSIRKKEEFLKLFEKL